MRVPGTTTLRREYWRWRGRLLGDGVILGYHRVADDPENPHYLAVSPSHFREQIEVLRRHFDLVSLTEMARQYDLAPGNASEPVGGQPTSRRPLTLTFDDAYVDVLENALPQVEEYGIPVTVFVVTEVLGDKRFRWDVDRGGVEGRPVNVEELRELADRPGVDIGAHTLTHPDLTTLPLPQIQREVVESRRRLEDLLGRSVPTFAYPHGGLDHRVRSAVETAGYEMACASRSGLVTSSTDPLRLPRFWPQDIPGEAFEVWLASWAGTPRTGRAPS